MSKNKLSEIVRDVKSGESEKKSKSNSGLSVIVQDVKSRQSEKMSKSTNRLSEIVRDTKSGQSEKVSKNISGLSGKVSDGKSGPSEKMSKSSSGLSKTVRDVKCGPSEKMSKSNNGFSEAEIDSLLSKMMRDLNSGPSGWEKEHLKRPQLPYDEEHAVKTGYCGPGLLFFKIGTLAKFSVQFIDAPPSPTICFLLRNTRTGETRNLNYIIKQNSYSVIYTLFETDTYQIFIKVNGETQVIYPTMGLDNESFTESLQKTTEELFKILQEVSTEAHLKNKETITRICSIF